MTESAILAAATGYQALAAALVQDALTTDPGWFRREPAAAEFWLDVSGVDPDQFWEEWDRRLACDAKDTR